MVPSNYQRLCGAPSGLRLADIVQSLRGLYKCAPVLANRLRVAERVWLPLEGHGPPEETKLSRYSQPFLKRCIVIPSKPSFV
jgi:hypothetical protein